MVMNKRVLRNLLSAATLVAALTTGTALAAEPAAPRKVVVGTYVNQIHNIDLKGNQFSVDFYVWFRWRGDDLKPLDTFELTNGRITSKTGISKKQIGDESYAACRVVATVTKFWDVRRYPLDGHSLELVIEDSEHESHEMVFVADEANGGLSPKVRAPGWEVKKSGGHVVDQTYRTNYGDTSTPTGHESIYSSYLFDIDLERPGYGRFAKVFFALFIATLISWCAFWVRPKDSSPRVSLGVGATFAAAAVTLGINNGLPDTSAITLADKLVMLSFASILSSLVVTLTALALAAQGRDATQRRMDRACAVLFPAVYVALAIVLVRT